MKCTSRLPALWAIISSAPVLMSLALASAVAFSIGHHFFYAKLDGQPSSTSIRPVHGLSYGLSGQQFNLAVGTLFAFLVKTLLGTACSISHRQAVWRGLRADSTELGTIDDMFVSRANPLALLRLRLWISNPISVLLALVCWLLPIASLFTPATLNIQTMTFSSWSFMRVPRVDFTSLNFADLQKIESSAIDVRYVNPQFSVQQVVTATATGGKILPISAPFPNSSWHLDFYGPALTCASVTSHLRENITTQYVLALNSTRNRCSVAHEYISWVPFAGKDGRLTPDGFLPLDYDNINGIPVYAFRPNTIGPMGYGGSHPLSIFLWAPGLSWDDPKFSYCCLQNPGNCFAEYRSQIFNAPLIQCTPYNASYMTNFTYTDGVQSVDVSVSEKFRELTFISGAAGVNPWAATFPNGSYILSSDGSIQYNGSAVAVISYQAVVHAFGEVIVGNIFSGSAGPGDNGVKVNGAVVNTSIGSTSLLNTKELSFLYNFGNKSLAQIEMGTWWNGHSAVQPGGFSLGLAEALEELFQNCTVSLMSASLLQPNYSSIYAPADTNVTTTASENVYVYRKDLLWVSYGLAIAASVIGVAVGLGAVVRNKGSYEDNFSTAMRVTHGARLSHPFRREETSGKGPLTEEARKIVVIFPLEEEQPGYSSPGQDRAEANRFLYNSENGNE